MGMSQSDFDRLGSTVVALGNNFATTEADVMRMAMRMASVGNTLNMSEADVLAFATAMSSVGILAEVGGSSFSTFASNLQLAVATNSKSLKTYASVAGMTTKEFKKAFEEDATSAIMAFITGLGKVESTGKTAIEVLDSLGISEVGQRNMLLALASSGDLLNQTLNLSADAWEQNIALLKEASTRYGTTESQIQIMKNAMDLIKLDIGDMALPHLKTLTTLVVSATEAFLGMSRESKILGVKMAALAAATGPVLVAAGQLLPMLTNIAPAMMAMVSPLGLAASGLGLFAVAAIDADNTIGKTFSKMSKAAVRYLDTIDDQVLAAILSVSGRMPELAASLADGIETALPRITSSTLGIVAAMGSMIADNSDELLNLGLTVVESIVSGVSQSLPKIVASGADLVSGFIEAFTSGRISESVKTMFASIKAGVEETDWAAAGTQIVDSITGAVTGLKTAITGKFDEAKTYVKELTWSDVAESIKTGISIPSDWLKGVILGDALTDESTWKDVGTKVWGWIKGGFTAAEGWLKNLILGDGGADEGWSAVGNEIVSKISSSLTALTPEKMAEGIGDLSTIASTIIDKIINSKADFAVAASDLITKLVSGISSFTGWESIGTSLTTFASSLVDSMVSAIGKTTGAASKVVGAIGGLFEGISLEDMASTFSGLADILIDGLVSAIHAGISGVTKITGAIADTLSSLNAEGTGTIIGDLGADIFDSILDGITNAAVAPDMSAFMANLSSGIEGSLTLLGDIAGKIAGYITSPEGINSIISAGGSLASALFAGLTAGVHGLASGIGNALSSIFKEVGANLLEAVGIDSSEFASKIDEMVSSMFGETGKAIGEMTDEQMQAYGHKLVNGLGTILEQAEAWVALEAAGYGETFAQYAEASFDTAGLTLAKALADGFNGDIEQQTYAMAALMANGMGNGLKEQYPQLWMAAAEMANEGIAPSLEEACQKLGLDIPDNIAQAIGANWSVVTEELTTQGESVRVLLSDLGMDAGAILGFTLPQGVTAGIENGELVLRDAVGRVVDIASMAASQADVESQSATSGQAAMDSASQAVTDNAYKVEDSTETAEAGMEAAMLPIESSFENMSRNAMTSMCSVTNAMSPSLAMASSNAATTAVNAAKSVMNSTAGYNIGRDVMQGMINAIRAMSGTLASAARSAVNNAISAMRKAADAHSPSRKTLALGEDMDEGGAIGLSGGLMAAAAAQATKDAVRAMAAEAYISDPGAGTVMTARQSARQVANETARSISEGDNSSFARDVGTAMADRLIESGALEGDVYIGEEKVGKKLTKPISKNVAKKSKYTVKGRSAREVVLA